MYNYQINLELLMLPRSFQSCVTLGFQFDSHLRRAITTLIPSVHGDINYIEVVLFETRYAGICTKTLSFSKCKWNHYINGPLMFCIYFLHTCLPTQTAHLFIKLIVRIFKYSSLFLIKFRTFEKDACSGVERVYILQC